MSHSRRLIQIILALAVFATACSPDPTTGSPSSTSTTAPVATTSTVTESGRTIEIVGCDATPQAAEIVCEAYDLIQTRYVDALADVELANAAARGLDDLDGATATGTLTCAAPATPFTEVCDLVGDEAEDTDEAAVAMVTGLANYALDANSVYLDAEALALVEEEQEGEIQGIGALVKAEDSSSGEPQQCSIVSETCRLTVVSTIDGSPAQAAGLQRDDVLIGVNGDDVHGWTVDEVTAAVRGPAGSDVLLTIERGGDRLEVDITRAAVVIPVVTSERIGNAGYVKLNIFTDNADEQFEDVVAEMLDLGVDSLVVDLRDNPGGLLDTAIEITSQFLPDGQVVVTQGPGSSNSYEVTGETTVPEDIRVVLVVNAGSASAAEVFSAVLQERGRATVVGESTFGKNTVQQRFSLSNGGALKLTIARWLTPDGLDFGGSGVRPDVTFELGPDLTAEEVVTRVLEASRL